jgi:hypothetical protein
MKYIAFNQALGLALASDLHSDSTQCQISTTTDEYYSADSKEQANSREG